MSLLDFSRFTTFEPPQATNQGFQRRTALHIRRPVAASPRTSWRRRQRCVQSGYPRAADPERRSRCASPRRPTDEAAIDVVPQRQARAAPQGFEFPPDIVYSSTLGASARVTLVSCGWRSHPGELHRGSNRAQAPIDLKGSPLAQMRRVGKRLPDFFRRVAQIADENERPLLSVLSYLRAAGRTRCRTARDRSLSSP